VNSAYSPFDAAAATYDAQFTSTRLGRWLREAVWSYLAKTFRPGDHVLELGCGTGEDAAWLARQGVRVLATDASLAMLAVAQSKIAATGLTDRVHLLQMNLNRRAEMADMDTGSDHSPFCFPSSAFDGAFSNFGAFNCLVERRPVAQALAGVIRPGGHLVLVLMGPTCPWELGWHLLHGKPWQAFRRFRSGVDAQLGQGITAPVWYPSPRRLEAEFEPWFVMRRMAGIGSLLPPSYLGYLVDRWPNIFRLVARLDQRLGTTWPWTWLNDHYLMILERR
jgi:SAM-dependent methyltransferase